MEFRFLETTIIAMKGPPFTRKTEFATLIAGSLDCPLLSQEHILDVLQPSHFQNSSSNPQDLAFQIICRMARDLIWKGVSKHVVIDSPLSSAYHLRQLTEVASASNSKVVRVVIVEWKPMNTYLWKMTFEKQVVQNPEWNEKWYKPKSWEDVEKVIKDYDYDERSVEGHELVSKLVVDPLLDLPIIDMHFSEFLLNPDDHKTPHFIEAVKYMITRYEGDDVVLYRQWRQSLVDNDGPSVKSCSDGGHNIYKSMAVEGPRLEYEEACMACQKQVMRSDDAYKCKDCSLALHKECAESYDINNTGESPFPRFRFNYEYHFPEELACNPCRRKGEDFSDECATCLFETHLRCRLMPTVINHVDTEEHLLTIVLLPAKNNEIYRCVVCGQDDLFNLYLCRIYGVAYHYECVNLPRRVEGEHRGNHHHLSLKFSSEQAEDYVCDECEEKRDPWLWFYSCEECAYEVHSCCV